MSRPKVLLLGERARDLVRHRPPSRHRHPQSADRAAFLAECRSGALDGVVAAYRTFASNAATGHLDAEAVPLLPESLRYVCHNGAGYDSIDVAACTARGIGVSHTPHAVDDATADLGLWLLLGALRNLAPGLGSLRAGRWRSVDAAGTLPDKGHDPRGKTLGILGMGGIGRNMARKAALAFGMKIIYHNRTRLAPEDEREAGEARYVGFEELLRESDVLSLNLPLNPSTRHTISHPQLAQTKPGVVIVNTARGAVVDEAALAAFLDRGHVAAVGLDVYEHEPQVHPALARHPRALLVPHMGTWTVETERAMEEATMANLRGALAGTGLTSGVPEQRGLTF
ncbi:D-isomer specific 2-hydroxyacid dehydrogenase [Apiospora hydei]|uniref:D-isomer specific 2-hydroxyacid dehydrogenase n=1 Tax=Apiospora hydei TaxID=1337664 RepID=A0ABR1UU61_9PEZI